MSTITRRQFLANASLATGALAWGGLLPAAEQPPARTTAGSDIVTLGKTGIKTSA